MVRAVRLAFGGVVGAPRSALANERVQTNVAGQVVLKLKTAWHAATRTW
jgi:hypothetical protein